MSQPILNTRADPLLARAGAERRPEITASETGTCPRCGARLPAERFEACPACWWDAPLEQEVLAGRFELQGELGRGGLGVVHRAFDRVTGTELAVKVLRPELVGLPEAEQRFEREARLLARLQHPGIVRFRRFGREDGRAFIVMQLVDGRPLSTFLPLRQDRALEIVRQVGQAVQYAHEQGLAHRDLKPANILVDAQGGVKLADFGIAAVFEEHERFTRHGEFVGTPDYMAPEARQGAAPDPRQDVFALGVLTYELLTGQLPVGLPQAPPEPVGGALARAMSRDPNDRQASVDEFLRELLPRGDGLPPGEVFAAGALAIGFTLALTFLGEGLLGLGREPERALIALGLGAVALGISHGARRVWLRRIRRLGLLAALPGTPLVLVLIAWISVFVRTLQLFAPTQGLRPVADALAQLALAGVVLTALVLEADKRRPHRDSLWCLSGGLVALASWVLPLLGRAIAS